MLRGIMTEVKYYFFIIKNSNMSRSPLPVS